MLKSKAFRILCVLLYLTGAAFIYFFMHQTPTVTFGDKTYKLTETVQTFDRTAFTYTGEDGVVTGESCLSCGGMVVTIDGDVYVTGKSLRQSGSYNEGTSATGCGHETGGPLTHEQVYGAVRQAAQYQHRLGYRYTIWIYWAAVAVAMFLGLRGFGKSRKAGYSWPMLVCAVVMVIAVFYDMFRL